MSEKEVEIFKLYPFFVRIVRFLKKKLTLHLKGDAVKFKKNCFFLSLKI